MTHSDYFMLSACLWKEARGEGNNGMLAVACVVRNRTTKHHSSYYSEIVAPWQFSSITAKGDSQLILWPKESDPLWQQAQLIATNVIDGSVQDITGGATLYWNPNGIQSDRLFKLNDGSMVSFPASWNAKVVSETMQIGHHIFLKEL